MHNDMKSMKKYINIPAAGRRLCTVACLAGALASTTVLTSCEDFFEQDSSYVIYEGDNPLNSATDTVYSVIGIMGKIQKIADRTILLGEVRGDLMDISGNTSTDLRDMALFTMNDDNVYNQPRDYYAIINNCNYYIAHVDTAIRNNRNEQLFLPEYAAVKAYRAWTYLQLALNYGSVPFVTEPILTQEEADAEYPRYGIQEVCDYFIQDLQGLEDVEYPGYGDIRGLNSQFFYFPIRILLGDLNLWAGNYRAAALNYYGYINRRNGDNSYYATTVARYRWNEEWGNSYNYVSFDNNETYNSQAELITLIPGDSIPSEGVYSQLRNLFNSFSSVSGSTMALRVNEENNGKVSLVPSAALKELSAAQVHCVVTTNADGTKLNDTLYVPKTIDGWDYPGDLRLWHWAGRYSDYQINIDNVQTQAQMIAKYTTRNVHIYRRMMVYLRMAEALNRAGFPRMAYQILATGLNNGIIEEKVLPYHTSMDEQAFISQFDFPDTKYKLYSASSLLSYADVNTIGIHSRGSGFSDANEHYLMPEGDASCQDASDSLAYQIEKVEDMIMDEGALEFAFEGTRYYDLMRVALRRGEPAYLADKVYARSGKGQNAIQTDLYNTNNWYLNWGGQIGLK